MNGAAESSTNKEIAIIYKRWDVTKELMFSIMFIFIFVYTFMIDPVWIEQNSATWKYNINPLKS